MSGRPPDGVEHVERLEGADSSKQRLKVILETISGTKSVKEACAELSVSEARFHVLRRQALQAALEGIEPSSAGRPPAAPAEPAAERIERLEAETLRLRTELHAARVRTEIALTMPHLLRGEPTSPGRAQRHRRKPPK